VANQGPKIEYVKVKGFKSFCHPLTLNFNQGVTAIVGPNGAGKSNVIDVLSFVMGSLSFSTMRSKRARELLYVGKTTRANHAVVELMLSGVPEELGDGGRLKISRKLFSDGTSVYRMNDAKTTRLNVLDALTSLNIFSDGHNMVKQGDINRFVKMSSGDRKALVDTIAGIELYEKKKARAFTDLNGVEIKLEKVGAVHEERLRIYRGLQDERQKVERFYELKELEKRARFGSLLVKKTALEDQLARKLKEGEELDRRISDFKTRLKAAREELEAFNREMEDEGVARQIKVIQQYEAVKFEMEKLEGEKRACLQEVKNLHGREEAIKLQLEGLQRRKTQLETGLEAKQPRITEVEGRLVLLKEKQATLATDLARARQAYEARKQQADRLLEQKNELTLQLKELELERSSHEQFLTSLKNELDRLKQKRLNLEAERQHFTEQQKQLEVQFRKLRQEEVKAREHLTGLRQQRDNLLALGMPAGSKQVKAAGFRLLGETLKETELASVAPFIFSAVADESQLTTLEKVVKEAKTWAVVLPKDVNLADLKQRTRGLKVIGHPSRMEFEDEAARLQKMEAVSLQISKAEKQVEELQGKLVFLQTQLNRKFDLQPMKDVEARMKAIGVEETSRHKAIDRLETSVSHVREQLGRIRIEEVKLPDFQTLENLGTQINQLETERIQLTSDVKVDRETLDKLIVPEMDKLSKLLKELAVAIQAEMEKGESFDGKLKEVGDRLSKLEKTRGEMESQLKIRLNRKTQLESKVTDLQAKVFDEQANSKILASKLEELEVARVDLNERATEFEGVKSVENPVQVLSKVLKEIDQLGELNFRARDEFDKIKGLIQEIEGRLQKLSEEREAILKMVEEIESQKMTKFMETYEGIRKHFTRIFKHVLGGVADLELEQDEEGLSGISIKVVINDREMSVDALSGGQKTLTALAFIFAIQYFKPSPLYVFDEVEAALDKDNSQKFTVMLMDMAKTAQILVVTHNDITVKSADQIIGVYMHKGVSRVISLPKEKVLSEEKWLARPDESDKSEEPEEPEHTI